MSVYEVKWEKQVPSAPDNKFELLDVVQQVTKLSAANKKFTDNLAQIQDIKGSVYYNTREQQIKYNRKDQPIYSLSQDLAS